MQMLAPRAALDLKEADAKNGDLDFNDASDLIAEASKLRRLPRGGFVAHQITFGM
jgi:hypothetical protein